MLRRIGLAVLVSLVICSVWWFRTRSDGQLHIIIPNIAGDGMLIQTPHGTWLLIDGSRDAVALTTLTAEYVPLWEQSFGALVLTSSDERRLPGALALARKYSFDHALLAPTHTNPAALSLVQTLAAKPTRINALDAGTTLTIDGVTLRVLVPPDESGGAVMMLEYGEFRAVLAPAAGDVQAAAVLNAAPTATLLWWPWKRHDSRQIAERLHASAVVYSEGTAKTTEELTFDERGGNQRRLLHKDLHGTIRITSDSSTFTITTEHE